MRKFNLENLEAKLASRKYERDYTSIPNNKLGTDENKIILKEVMEALDLEWDDNASYFTVRAKEGIIDRLYAPTVYLCEADDGSGDKFPALRFSRDLNIPLSAIEQKVDMDFDQSALTLYVPSKDEDESKDILAFFRIFTKESGENAPSASELKQAYKKKKLGYLLGDAPKQQLSAKLADLEDGTTLTITGYSILDAKFGKTYKLKADDGYSYLANSHCKKILAASPIINEDKPATLEVLAKSQTKTGKTMVHVDLKVAPDAYGKSNDLDLDF